MIIETKADFLDTNEEVLPMDSDSFPYLCMSSELNAESHEVTCVHEQAAKRIANVRFTQTGRKGIGWHWHSAFEIDYVVDGSITFGTTEKSVTLPKGGAIFFNANVLHCLQIPDGKVKGETCAQFFYGSFLSGGIGNTMERKYVFPVLGNDELPFFCLYPDKEEDREMLGYVEDALTLCREEPFGYEFAIRSLMCSFWLALHRRFADCLAHPVNRKKNDEIRLKTMLKYMQQHFSEKLMLEQIAAAANLGTRECSRCFSRTIGASPMQYLNQYRLEQAAQRLLKTQEPIIQISEECGFFSNSYFSQCFRERFGCSPKEYRRWGKER